MIDHRIQSEPAPASVHTLRARILSRSGIALLVCVGTVAIVLTYYLWQMTVGTWVTWPSLSNVYDQMASGFLSGHLWLPEKPVHRLLTLPNPYQPAKRAGLPFPFDASLYKGHFYFYFGPVPAVLLAIDTAVTGAHLGDEYLVFWFTVGLFLVQAAFAFTIWRRFFRDGALWSLGAAVLVLGLSAPFGWMLATPHNYSTAILGGAFFLAAGMFTAFLALDRPTISRPLLVLAGICWSAAVGSRPPTLVQVIVLTVLVLTVTFLRNRGSGNVASAMRTSAALLLPLAAGALALGWYNWARFDSPFETGIRYQLSGGEFHEDWSQIFSPLYMIQNFANYMAAPFRLGYAFPYFKPTHGFRASVLEGFPLPKIYWSSPMTGLLFTAPFIVFSIVSAVHAFRVLRSHAQTDDEARSLAWLTVALWATVLSGFATFLTFFWSAERYYGDFVPAWLLASVIGFWQLGRSLRGRKAGPLVYVLLGIGLVGATIVVSNLLAIAFNAADFRRLNPVLWHQLGNLFRP